MPVKYVSRFTIGIFNPAACDRWPWHFHYDDGLYLSEKQRPCGMSKAAVFDTADAARQAFHAWKGNHKWKMEIIEYKERTYVSPPPPEPGTPLYILNEIQRYEHSFVHLTASWWFMGKGHIYSPATTKKHREKLLKYGIDINQPPVTLLEFPEPQSFEELAWESSRPTLKLF